MKKFWNALGGILVGGFVFASVVSIPQLNTRVVQIFHVNDTRNALTTDLVPRTYPSGLPSAAAGNLGSSTYPWGTANVGAIVNSGTTTTGAVTVLPSPGANGVVITAPSGMASPVPFVLPSALPAGTQTLTYTSAGVLGFANAINYVVSSSILSSTASTTPQAIAASLVTFTGQGVPVVIILTPDSNVGVIGATTPNTFGNSSASDYGVLDLYKNGSKIGRTSIIGATNQAIPSSIIFFDATSPSGSTTYQFYIHSLNGAGTTSIQGVLVAYSI